MVRVAADLRAALEPLGFSIAVDGNRIVVTDPNGKTDTLDLEDAYFLLKGLANEPEEVMESAYFGKLDVRALFPEQFELDYDHRENRLFKPNAHEPSTASQTGLKAPQTLTPLPRVIHPVSGAAKAILEAQGWTVREVSQEMHQQTGILLEAYRRGGSTYRAWVCPDCGSSDIEGGDGEVAGVYTVMWGCTACGAFGTSADLAQKRTAPTYRVYNLEQCEELVGSRVAVTVNERSSTPESRRRYGEKALESALADISALAGTQGRNSALNRIAFNLGQLLEPCSLSYDGVKHRLIDAALAIGLKPSEMATVDSGLKSGMKSPKEF